MAVKVEIGKYYQNYVGDIVEISRQCRDGVFEGGGGWLFSNDGSLVDPFRTNPALNLEKEISKEDVELIDLDIYHPEIRKDDVAFDQMPEIELPFFFARGIDPHGGRELGLMRAGFKPMSLIANIHWDKRWETLVSSLGWVVYESSQHKAVCPKPEAWRLSAFRLFEQASAGALSDDYEISIGGLLGYRQSDIDHYVDRRRRMLTYLEG